MMNDRNGGDDETLDLFAPPVLDSAEGIARTIHREYLTVGLDGSRTLAEARQYLANHLEEGERCPCCNRFTKFYGHRINGTMARSLLWLVGAAGRIRDWVDVPSLGPTWVVRTNQHATLHRWRLVERPDHEADTKKHSGLWRPTELGVEFAHGAAKVRLRVITYDGVVLGYAGPEVGIRDVLPEGFNYRDVMSWPSGNGP